MKKYFVVTILAAVSCTAALAQSPTNSMTPPSEPGIEGVIVLSPAHGGPIRIGESAAKPLTGIKFTVVREGESTPVASFTTDEQGRFRISLPPGHYQVAREGGKIAIGKFGPFDVTVAPGQMTAVQWNCDSGMR